MKNQGVRRLSTQTQPLETRWGFWSALCRTSTPHVADLASGAWCDGAGGGAGWLWCLESKRREPLPVHCPNPVLARHDAPFASAFVRLRTLLLATTRHESEAVRRHAARRLRASVRCRLRAQRKRTVHRTASSTRSTNLRHHKSPHHRTKDCSALFTGFRPPRIRIRGLATLVDQEMSDCSVRCFCS